MLYGRGPNAHHPGSWARMASRGMKSDPSVCVWVCVWEWGLTIDQVKEGKSNVKKVQRHQHRNKYQKRGLRMILMSWLLSELQLLLWSFSTTVVKIILHSFDVVRGFSSVEVFKIVAHLLGLVFLLYFYCEMVLLPGYTVYFMFCCNTNCPSWRISLKLELETW